MLPAAGGLVPGAANLASLASLASLAFSVVVWPLGCVFLVRQVLGSRPMLLGLAALLSAAFTGFPWVVLSWGVLWPNTLGIALLPALLASLMSAFGAARDDLLGGGSPGG